MNITVKTIPHKKQKYDTSGNWGFKNGNLWIEVSDMKNWKYEALIAVHELIEVLLCKARGIKEKDVTNFDVRFEKERIEDPLEIGNAEPGDQKNSPYYKEHQFASVIERMLSFELGVDWEEYNDVFNTLEYGQRKNKKS